MKSTNFLCALNHDNFRAVRAARPDLDLVQLTSITQLYGAQHATVYIVKGTAPQLDQDFLKEILTVSRTRLGIKTASLEP